MRRRYGPPVAAAMVPHVTLSVGNVALATSIASGAALQFTGITAAVGEMLVLAAASDNAGASGVASMSSTVTDSAGNTWTNRGGLINRTAGAANDGTTLGLWTCLVTNALVAGTVDLAFSPNTTAKAAALKTVSAVAGEVPQFHSAGTGGTGSAQTWNSGTISAVPSGYTLFAWSAVEFNSGAIGDSDTTNGSWSTRQIAIADTGTATTSQSIAGQHKTVTATGDQSYDSGIGGGSNRDYAWNWLILFGAP